MARPDTTLAIGGAAMGAGLGGFVDGILLHQVLQWHHMLAAHPDPAVANDLPLNVTADGLFHAATWLLTVVGLVLVVHAFRQGARVTRRGLLGMTLVGWGLFNLVEGVVDHQLLGIHHVHPSGHIGWDLAYLAMGLLFVVAGYGLWRSASADAPRVQRAATT